MRRPNTERTLALNRENLPIPKRSYRAEDDESYTFALEAAGIGTWFWHLATDEIICSRRCRELLGIGESAIEYRTFLALLNPQDRDWVDDAVRRCLREGGVFDVECRIRRNGDTGDRWIASKGRAEGGERGAPQRMIGVVQDVTARRLAESQRDELRRRLLQVQEDERLRLARNLHDQAGQELTRVLFDIKTLSAHVDAAGHKTLLRLHDQVMSIEECLRRVAVELRPTALDDLGLCQTLEEHLADWSDRSGIASQLECRGKLSNLPDEVGIALYRIAQEGLTNILKHARGATAVQVTLARTEDVVSLTIEDNGCGFDPLALSNAARGAGPALGIAGMRERLSLLNGELALHASPQGGTVLCASIESQSCEAGDP